MPRDDDITEAEAWSLILAALSRAGARDHEIAGAHRAARETDIPSQLLGFPGRQHSAAAAKLLEIFTPLLACGRALVIAQIGQSLDGRIATETGASHYINGEAARVHLHRLRAIVDAVVIGVGTLNADDPLLTVRHVEGPHPVRVVLDPSGRADPRSRLFHDGAAPVIHVLADRREGGGPAISGAERLLLPPHPGFGIEPAALIDALAARGLGRMLVEGGGVTVSRFLQAGVVERLHVMVAPMLIGSGRPGISLPPVSTLDQALRPACRVFACGEDSLFDLALRTSAGSLAAT